MKIEVNIEKKYAWLILGFLFLITGIIAINAYGTPTPSVFGHSISEINWSETIPSMKVSNLEVIQNLQVNGQILTGQLETNTCPPGYYWKTGTTSAYCEVSTLANPPTSTTCSGTYTIFAGTYSQISFGMTATLVNTGYGEGGTPSLVYQGSSSVNVGECPFYHTSPTHSLSCSRSWYGGSNWGSCSCTFTEGGCPAYEPYMIFS